METGTICYRPMVTRPIARNVHFLCARPLSTSLRFPFAYLTNKRRKVVTWPGFNSSGIRCWSGVKCRLFGRLAILRLTKPLGAAQIAPTRGLIYNLRDRCLSEVQTFIIDTNRARVYCWPRHFAG